MAAGDRFKPVRLNGFGTQHADRFPGEGSPHHRSTGLTTILAGKHEALRSCPGALTQDDGNPLDSEAECCLVVTDFLAGRLERLQRKLQGTRVVVVAVGSNIEGIGGQRISGHDQGRRK